MFASIESCIGRLEPVIVNVCGHFTVAMHLHSHVGIVYNPLYTLCVLYHYWTRVPNYRYLWRN